MLQYRKDLFKLSNVVLNSFALNEHVIHIHLYISPNLLLEDLVDEPLVTHPHILQIKRYDPVIKKTFVSSKDNPLLILKDHADLIIVREDIYEGEELVIRSGIHQLIDLRQ